MRIPPSPPAFFKISELFQNRERPTKGSWKRVPPVVPPNSSWQPRQAHVPNVVEAVVVKPTIGVRGVRFDVTVDRLPGA